MIRAVEERLQKILARAGFASRRGAEELMLEGRVTVNGETAREPGTKADASTDDIRVDGVRVKVAVQPVYLVLNKPKGIVTTRHDPAGRATVMTLVPSVAGLFPVGRLDVTTEGLILLTNDGAFAERVSHPRYEVPRVYHAKVHGVPDERTLERLRKGVRLEGDVLQVDRVRVLETDKNAWLELTLHEGKRHEVKRLLEALGHPVSKLKRVSFGPVTTKGLEPGQFRALTPGEVAGLVRGEASPETHVRRLHRAARPVAPHPRGTSARRPPFPKGAHGDRGAVRDRGAHGSQRRRSEGWDRQTGLRRRRPDGRGGRRPGAAGRDSGGGGRGGRR
jgi:pseudouridine synthase